MSKGIKILWIVIGCLFGLGVILTGIGIAFGASGGVYLDREGFHFGQRSEQTLEISDENTEAFSDIDISLLQANVEIVVAENYGYTFSYTGTREPSVVVSNGKLKVVEDEENWVLNIFNLGIFDRAEAKLVVYVPEDARLNKVVLETAAGDTSLNAHQLSIADLSCSSASGYVNLNGLVLEHLSLELASGDANLEEVSAESASISMASGWLHCNKVEMESLSIDMASGDVELTGTVSRFLNLQMVSGYADIVLDGNADDYSITVDKLSGDVSVNGNSIDSSYQTGGSANAHIEVDLTSGTVNFSFRD